MFGHGPDIEKRTGQIAFPVATLLVARGEAGAVLLALDPQTAGSGVIFAHAADSGGAFALSAFYIILICRERKNI